MKNVIGILAGLLSVLAIAISLYAINYTPKIGYIQSQEMIYGYEGTKEVQTKFNIKKDSWQANIDTLELDFQKAVNRYNSEVANLSQTEKERRELGLRTQQENTRKYIETIDQKIAEEEEEMITGVLNQINALVEEYGVSHNYSMIYGTTAAGNVLYGLEKHDITDEVLGFLNNKFRGE